MKTMVRTYHELKTFDTFEERFKYLQLKGQVGADTFGYDRIFNQRFYQSREWQAIRNEVIIRDNGCDLGVEGYDIPGRVVIHHMNPITLEDIENCTDILMNPEYLISTTHETHNAIHYGDDKILRCKTLVERRPGDTIPWKK